MSDNIIKEFEKVLILDNHTDLKILSIEDQLKLNGYLNPHAWYKFINQSRNVFAKNKTRYNNLIDKTGDHLKKQLERIIVEKLEALKRGAISTPKENSKKGAISTVYIDGNCTLNEIKNLKGCSNTKTSICLITGLNISMQKDDSILLSHSGLRHYYKNELKTFEQIKSQFLSKVWFKSDFETQIKEIAHNIRNTNSNRTIKQKRIYKPYQLNILITLGI